VVHCAAVLPSAVGGDVFGVNVGWTLELFEICADLGKPFVLIGRSHHYDHLLPASTVSESAQRTWRYVTSKRVATETLLREAARLDSRATVLCIPSPYGPGARPDSVLPQWLRAAMRDHRIRVHGKGHRRQMFVFNDDIGRAVSRLFTREVEVPPGRYLVGGPDKVTMRELAEAIGSIVEDLTGVTVTVEVGREPDPTDSHDFDWNGLGIPPLPGYAPACSLPQGLRVCVESASLESPCADLVEARLE
jgi:nucleoside-diphosphate-sugar epimerase